MRRHPLRNILFLVLVAAVCASCATTRLASGPSESTLEYKFDAESLSRFPNMGQSTPQLSPSPSQTLVAKPVLFSKQPRYGVIGSGEAEAAGPVFVLDESKGTGSGYDTLYVDANNNKDLSDDPKIVAKASAQGSNSEFPAAEVSVGSNDQPYPYHVKLRTCGSNDHVHVTSAGYCEGVVTFGASTYGVALFDDNGNGLFNDPHAPISGRDRKGAVYARGDTMVIDLDADGELEKGSRDTPELFHLGKYISLGSICYEVEVAQNGRSITVRETTAPLGGIKSAHEQFSAELLGSDGALKLTGASRKAMAPAGTYQLSSCSFEGQDDAGASWSIVGKGDWAQAPIEVAQGTSTSLEFGPPLIASVDASNNGDNFTFKLNVKGQGGAVFSARDFQVDGEQAPAPRIEIRDSRGETIAKGKFEYG